MVAGERTTRVSARHGQLRPELCQLALQLVARALYLLVLRQRGGPLRLVAGQLAAALRLAQLALAVCLLDRRFRLRKQLFQAVQSNTRYIEGMLNCQPPSSLTVHPHVQSEGLPAS